MKVPNVSAQSRRIASAALALVLGYGFILSRIDAWSHVAAEIGNEFSVAKYERRNGTFIAELFSPLPQLPSIGVIASGGIKYAYPGEIVDLFGLNNTVMAHNHGDRMGYKNHAAFEIRTFFQLQPDIVWPVYVNESNWEFNETELQQRWENRLGFKGLFDDPDFLELYEYGKVSKRSEAGKGLALVAWFEKDFLRHVIADPNFDVAVYEYTP